MRAHKCTKCAFHLHRDTRNFPRLVAKLKACCCCSHQNWPVQCAATASASSSVRVTKFPDGSVTYHFSETAHRQTDVEQLQHPDTSALISPQQDSYSSNGAADEVRQHQEAGADAASVRAGSAVLTEPQQQPLTQQEQGQNGGASPNWSLDLDWDSQPSSVSADDSTAIKQKVVRKLRQAAKQTNGKHASTQIPQPAETYSNLDSKLDFDNGDTQMLLRAYNSRVAAGRLHAALGVLETLVAAGRTDVLKRCAAVARDLTLPIVLILIRASLFIVSCLRRR